MWADLLCVLWVFAPAGLANMAPVFAARVHVLDGLGVPIDQGRTFRGKRVFGDHKTWRGLLAGVVVATLTLLVQQVLTRHVAWFARLTDPVPGLRFATLPVLVVGPLFGVGALGGDAIKSFFKRQVGVPPGKRWFPFDQVDFILGSAVAVLPFIRLSLLQYALLLVIWVGLHMAVTCIAWLLHLKDSPL